MTGEARPAGGVGHYLRDLVYGATDGVVTTLAVIAGVSGAALSPWVGFVLGVANLIADGLSMAVSNYLGLKSELEQNHGSIADEKPWRHGAATLAAFVVVGGVPLLAFAIDVPGMSRFQVALAAGALALAAAGGGRARFVSRSRVRCAIEMLVLAGAAAAVAYLVGVALAPLADHANG